MNSCELCGKEFNFPYLLLRHLNKKNPCSSNIFSAKKLENVQDLEKNVCENKKNVCDDKKNVCDGQKNVCEIKKNVCDEIEKNFSDKKFECERCKKVLKSNQGLKRHSKVCKGVHVLQCPTCLKTFSDRSSKSIHIKNVKCSPEEKVNLEEENRLLRKENAILKSKGSNVVNNNNSHNTSYITNYTTIKYELKYNPETRCLTTDDPDAPFPELLCFNGFKLEAARSKLKDIDKDMLQEHIDNVRDRKDYYSLYTFFFRNVDNRRLQMFNLGKNNNATHAQVFNNGAIEKVEKSQLFENVCKYIGQYLLNMSIENADVITMITTEQASKTAFLEVTRDRSNVFEYYRAME